MKKTILIELINGLLILLFVYSGCAKLIDFSAFERAMHNQPFPYWVAELAIYTIPVLELGVATLLMFSKWRRLGLYIFLILMILFTIYIGAIILNIFPRHPCSCGELIRSLTWTQHMWFNVAFLLLAIIAIKFNRESEYKPTKKIHLKG